MSKTKTDGRRQIPETYEKFCRGETLSDDELKLMLNTFAQATESLRYMGPRFFLAWAEANRVRQALTEVRDIRKAATKATKKEDKDSEASSEYKVIDGIRIATQPDAKIRECTVGSLPPQMQALARAEARCMGMSGRPSVLNAMTVRSALKFNMPFAIEVNLGICSPNFLIVPAKHTCANGMYLPATLSGDFNPDMSSISDGCGMFCVINISRRCAIDKEDGSRMVYESIFDAVDDVIRLVRYGNDSSVCQ